MSLLTASMSACEACGKTEGDGVTLYRFPQEQEQLQHWIVSMRRAAAWRPSDSARLCSDHFTSDGFHTAGHLHSHAVPSVFQSTDETSATPQEQKLCAGCEKQLRLIEKSYKLQLLSAQLKAKKYEKELSEQSRKVSKLQRRMIVLQTAVKVMSMRKHKATPSSESSSTTTSLV